MAEFERTGEALSNAQEYAMDAADFFGQYGVYLVVAVLGAIGLALANRGTTEVVDAGRKAVDNIQKKKKPATA